MSYPAWAEGLVNRIKYSEWQSNFTRRSGENGGKLIVLEAYWILIVEWKNLLVLCQEINQNNDKYKTDSN